MSDLASIAVAFGTGTLKGRVWMPLNAYVDLRAEAGFDPSSEMLCVLSPDLTVCIDNGEAWCPELEEIG